MRRELANCRSDWLAKLFEVTGKLPAHGCPEVDLTGHKHTNRSTFSVPGRLHHFHRTRSCKNIRPAWRHRNQNEISNIDSNLSGSLKVWRTVNDDCEFSGLIQNFLPPALRPARVFKRQRSNFDGQSAFFRPRSGCSLLIRVHK